MSQRTGMLLISRDVGAQRRRSEVEELSRQLELRLQQPVRCVWLDESVESLAEGIQSLIDQACHRLVLHPFGLAPMEEHGSIQRAAEWAMQQWPFLEIHRAPPLTWLEWTHWLLAAVNDAARSSPVITTEIGVVLVGRATADPLINADIARLAHLIRERSDFHTVSYGLIGGARPELSEALQVLSRNSLQQIMIVPWGISRDDDLDLEKRRADQSANCPLTLVEPALCHPALINLLIANHLAAVPVPRGGRSTLAEELVALQDRINALLPSEYQGSYETVSPQSMGSAGLKYDSEGKVAWGEIWTSFCDLALAGGPPHRGTLLEAVTAEEALADPARYAAVVAEIERGIRLVTSLPLVTSQTPGWIGVRCESEEMAVWLMRAIIVENIMVRREGDVLYLPAGPKFTVKREIKNVITAIAKTVHYWQAHLLSRRALYEP